MNAILDAGLIHARRNVDGVAPNVVVEFGGADDTGGDWPNVEANLAFELEIEQILVEEGQRILQPNGELHELKIEGRSQ